MKTGLRSLELSDGNPLHCVYVRVKKEEGRRKKEEGRRKMKMKKKKEKEKEKITAHPVLHNQPRQLLLGIRMRCTRKIF